MNLYTEQGNMDEERRQNYLELISRLLQCDSGTKTDFLEAHPELVNEQFVKAILAVARMMGQQNDPELVSTLQYFLINFAPQLAVVLDLEVEKEDNADSQLQLNFLLNLFQTIADSGTNPQVVYPILQDNLPLLNENLIPLVTSVLNKFGESGDEARQNCAAIIVGFASLIQQFPLGSRLINLEIAIHCCWLAQDVYKGETYPEPMLNKFKPSETRSMLLIRRNTSG